MERRSFYQRFRAWQLNPFKPEKTDGRSHRCANCSEEFQGNYCPRCGQAHDVGKVGWGTLFHEFRDNLGFGDPGSFLFFVLQLFGRPGYMISDYLHGRRKVCSAPAGRLALIAGITLLVLGFVRKDAAPEALPGAEVGGFLGTVLGWLSSHLEWAVIIQTALLAFPTWLLFRYAPAYPRHTWPEGIYIQLFMGSIVLICIMLRAVAGNVVLLLIPIYYYIAYKQLFGYGIWGTLWRTVLCFGIIFYFFGISMAVSLRLSGGFWAGHTTWEFLSMFGAFLLLGAGLLALGWWFGRRSGIRA